MSVVPLIPETAPFSAEQRAWLNGFLAGLFSRSEAPRAGPAETPRSTPLPLTIVFGSQTGTAEALARRAAKEAGRRGFTAAVVDAAQLDIGKLAAERNLLLITSTYGDGEPPDNARALHAALAETCRIAADTKTPARRFAGLRYSVCALGDSNYTQFCQCGRDFDAFLEQQGATRVAARVDCDVDAEATFVRWLDAALTAMAGGSKDDPAPHQVRGPETPLAIASAAVASAASESYSRQHPFPARLITSRQLNAPGSAKRVQHIEFEIAEAGLGYEPGDALGVVPQNCPQLVTEVLAALEYDGEEAVPAPDGATTSLRRALAELCDLGRPSPELLALLSPAPAGRHAPGGTAAVPHVLDLLQAGGDMRPAPADFARALRRLQPRLYSISSSPRAHPGQVHLTVGVVRYAADGRTRKGVCSTFLAERLVPGESRAGIFVHRNTAFRLPAGGDVPLIMIGPGTGIAPFRAFLHERRVLGARGRNWLFFGDQHAATDFLYADELAALQREGVLARLDTAFSRDQPEKIYVQHRMAEHAAELYAWLEDGAHVYVCGDATRMAKDVDAALHRVIERGGGRTAAQAADYVEALRAAKRYARDVY